MNELTRRFARWLYRVSVSLDPDILNEGQPTKLFSYEENIVDPRLASMRNITQVRNLMQAFECHAEIVRHDHDHPPIPG
jgi:hypothetical protein